MSDGTVGHPGTSKRDWRSILETYGGLIALVVLFLFTALMKDSFTRPENLINILRQNSFVGIIAIGMTFVIISGGIDLSVGSMVALIGCVSIATMNAVIESSGNETFGVLVGYSVALLMGPALGWVNGAIVTFGRVAPFIATLGGMAGYRSIALVMADGAEIRSSSAELFSTIGREGIPIPLMEVAPGRPLVLYWPIVIFLGLAIVSHVLLNSTRYGRYVYAVGCNETAARYSAINTPRVKRRTYVLIGACTGIASLLLCSRMNSVGSSNIGSLYELDAIAAVVIGGTRMEGGKGRIWGTVVGVLILGIIGNMLVMLKVSPYLQGLVKGMIIIAAVLLQRSRVR